MLRGIVCRGCTAVSYTHLDVYKRQVLKVNPATKIVAMGDFNDDPTDPSMLAGLNKSTLRTRSGSVIKKNFQACKLLALGASLPASASFKSSSSETGRLSNDRILRLCLIASDTSIRISFPKRPA